MVERLKLEFTAELSLEEETMCAHHGFRVLVFFVLVIVVLNFFLCDGWHADRRNPKP